MPRRKRSAATPEFRVRSTLELPDARRQLVAALYYERLVQHPPFAAGLQAIFSNIAEQEAKLSEGTGEKVSTALPTGIDDIGLANLGIDGLLSLANADKQAIKELGFVGDEDGKHAAEDENRKHAASRDWEPAKKALFWAKTWTETADPALPELHLLSEQVARWWLNVSTACLSRALSWLSQQRRALRIASVQALRTYSNTLIATLCQKWLLPSGAADDIWQCYIAWQAAGQPAPPVLRPAGLEATGPGAVMFHLHRLLPEAVIWQPLVESFPEFKKRLHDLLDEALAPVFDQAQKVVAQAPADGWQEPPYRTPDFALRAERLFRRAVLKQSWDQIRKDTGAAKPHARHLVRRQVLADAKLLGISLP